MNTQLDQRPWISATSLKLTKLQAGSKLEGQLAFINSGKSPALRISIMGAIMSVDKKIEPDFLPIGSASDATAFRAIPPQGSNIWTQDSAQIIGDDEKDRIEHTFHTIWMWGYIRYTDHFGGHYLTQFCGFTRDRLVTTKIAEGMDLELCPNNNDMN